jgi:hypothetical protein
MICRLPSPVTGYKYEKGHQAQDCLWDISVLYYPAAEYYTIFS